MSTGAPGSVRVSKLEEQTCKSEFESHWVPHSFGLVLHLRKKLSRLLLSKMSNAVGVKHLHNEDDIDNQNLPEVRTKKSHDNQERKKWRKIYGDNLTLLQMNRFSSQNTRRVHRWTNWIYKPLWNLVKTCCARGIFDAAFLVGWLVGLRRVTHNWIIKCRRQPLFFSMNYTLKGIGMIWTHVPTEEKCFKIGQYVFKSY